MRGAAITLLLLLAGVVQSASASDVRFATWNIANFWHVPGEYLRPARGGGPGLIRLRSDLAAIRAVIGQLGADVIGLQEMPSPQAVRALFPEEEWGLVFSGRLADDIADAPDKLDRPETRDIYTAIVYRKHLGEVVAVERLRGLSLAETSDDGEVRYTREGTAAKLRIGKREVWVVSLHLKSGCAHPNDLETHADPERPWVERACKMLAAQIPVLEQWVDEKIARGEHVILLGDFNRQLDRGNDAVRADLDDKDPADLLLTPHRQTILCPAHRHEPQVSVDYVIISESLREHARLGNRAPTVPVISEKISDHCPVWLDIDWD
jgi:endonuclease/exonuclease/phosphatase family metal-dependent hydrolase